MKQLHDAKMTGLADRGANMPSCSRPQREQPGAEFIHAIRKPLLLHYYQHWSAL